MPSAYTLARDKLEQARALLANEVWRDDQIDRVLDIAIARLIALDASLLDCTPHRTSHASRDEGAHQPIDMIAWSARPKN